MPSGVSPARTPRPQSPGSNPHGRQGRGAGLPGSLPPCPEGFDGGKVMKIKLFLVTLCLGVFVCFVAARPFATAAGGSSATAAGAPSATTAGGPPATGAGGPASTAAGGAWGCTQCHPKPSDVVPKGHPPGGGSDLQDCIKCHGEEKKIAAFAASIHLKHYAASKFPGDCRWCHRIGESKEFGLIGSGSLGKFKVSSDLARRLEPYFRSSGTSKYLDHRHAVKGVSCAACHGTALPEKGVQKDRCVQCHGGYEKLSKKSQIHASMTAPHFNGGNDCGLCHRAHSQSELTCVRCHEEIEMKVP